MRGIRVQRGVALASAFVLAACAVEVGSYDDEAMSEEAVGQVVLALKSIPTDVKCVKITATGNIVVTRSVDVTANTNAMVTLKGLPLGAVTFTEMAYNSSCSTVTSATVATWVSDSATAVLAPGTTPEIVLLLRRPGQAVVTSDFVDGSAPTLECPAQRTVHIVGGNGGLAWFTQIWPVPQVITNFNANYAFDNPTNASLIASTGTDHPLYVRKIGTRTVWSGIGSAGQASVFVAGTNQTHTNAPQTMVVGTVDVIAAGAVQQAALQAPLRALSFGSVNLLGTAPGAPTATSAFTIDSAIAALRTVTTISADMEASLRPSATTVSAWTGAGAPATVVDLAQRLLFTANAFRLGLISTVLMPAFSDDPHGAFADVAGTVTPRADALARVLDGFYAELAKSQEPKCSHRGAAVSLADNVVLVVSGDTYKNPFAASGWGDGTPGNSNLLYVRANGFLKPGWFGSITAPSTRTNFNPLTGLTDTAATAAQSTTAAQLGILFAITRGNRMPVTAVSGAEFSGVVAATLP